MDQRAKSAFEKAWLDQVMRLSMVAVAAIRLSGARLARRPDERPGILRGFGGGCGGGARVSAARG